MIDGLCRVFWAAGPIFFVSFPLGAGGRSENLEDSAITAAASFFAHMVSRGVAEGLIDFNRGPTPADVGQPKP